MQKFAIYLQEVKSDIYSLLILYKLLFLWVLFSRISLVKTLAKISTSIYGYL